MVKRPLPENLVTSVVIITILIVFFVLISFGPYVLGIMAPNFIYSEGDRVGQVIKLSNKGLIWKTWESGMGLTQSGAYVQYWDFSVDNEASNKNQLLKELTDAYNTGVIVRVHYVQRIGIIPWRGKTAYFIKSIETVRENPLNDIKEYNQKVKEYNKQLEGFEKDPK